MNDQVNQTGEESPAESGSGAADVARKAHRNPLAWLNLVLLALVVLAANYIGCSEYYRRDLTEDQRFTISEQTVNVLQSKLVQDRKEPVKVIFAFLRSTQNYNRMYALLEEYRRYGNGKVEIECFDPLRQPNRAREISQLYGVDYRQNQVIIDARPNTSAPLKTFEDDNSERRFTRVCPGDAFVKYETSADGRTKRAVALMMEEIVTSQMIGALEGSARKLYVVVGLGGVAQDDNSPIMSLGRICNSLNLSMESLDLKKVDAVPDDAAGVLLIGPKYDLEDREIAILRKYWQDHSPVKKLAPGEAMPTEVKDDSAVPAALFVVLDPQAAKLERLSRFLREQGIRPQYDRVLLADRARAYFDIDAEFPSDSLMCMRPFWDTGTHVEGQSMSLKLEHASEMMAGMKSLQSYPLMMASEAYYGETNPDLAPRFDVLEDNKGPLCLAAAVSMGKSSENARMVVFGNTEMMAPDKIKHEQMDFIRTMLAWMTDREEFSGKTSNHDMTLKINLDSKSMSFLEFLTLIAMPWGALIIALIIWNTRRH